MPSTTGVAMTGNADIDGVLSGVQWATNSLTFSFPDSMSEYGYSLTGFEAFNAAQQAAVRTVLDLYSSVSGLTFTEVTESASVHGDLRFAEEDNAGTAYSYYPSFNEFGGDAWFNHVHFNNPVKGTYAFSTVMHEIGHGLGLKHGHEGPTPLPYDHDSNEYSVMTYRSYVGSPGDYYTIASGSGPQTLMLSDIAAIQTMYGANYAHNAGNTVYTWSPTTGEMFVDGVGQGASNANKVFMTVWDGGGTDTYDFSNYTTDLNVDLRPGEWTTTAAAQLAKLGNDADLGGTQWARGNIANAWLFEDNPASLIENAIGGSGNDLIMGNEANNTIIGGEGDNRLWGELGNDIIYSGSGADRLGGGSGDDELHGGGGADIAWGNDGTDQLYGDDGDDQLWGGADDDLVWGGEGADRLGGQAGDDQIWGEAGSDTVWGDQGNDHLYGGIGDDFLWGWTGNDTISGGDGNDQIGGGEGDDELYGDADNDMLWAGTGADQAWGGTGDDRIGGGDGNDILWGEEGNDTIWGHGDDDQIHGGDGDDGLWAGSGDDQIWGGTGIDHIGGADGNDVIWAGGNSDTVWGGTGADEIHGEDGDDFLWADAGDDQVRGDAGNDQLGGGAGNDMLFGGDGDDTIWGAAGTDYLDGGLGIDELWGGGDADTFAFVEGWGLDTIGDWENGLDVLDFAALSTVGVHGVDDLVFATLLDYSTISFGVDTIIFTDFADPFDTDGWVFA